MNEPFETVQKFCPQCSEAVDTDARFCKYCAFDLANSNISQDISTEINQTRTKRNTLGILGAMCLLILGLIGVVIKFNSGRINQSAIENANSVSQSSASTLTLGEKAQQIEEKILRGEALGESDLEGLSATELRILRNVHFARYGRKYEKPGLGDYFYSQTWYKPSDNYKDSVISSTDKDNINLIVATETTLNNANTAVASATVTPEIQQTPETSVSELNRETVFSLLRGWNREVARGLPRRWGDNKLYERLMKDKVITCEKHYTIQGVTDNWDWYNCTPIGNVSGLTIENKETIKIEVGSKIMSEVTGISKIDENTAYADIVFTFQEGAGYGFYTKYYSDFGRLFNDEKGRAILRLYDDGWRVEKVVATD